MISEKKAREREAAVLNAVKPQYEKISQGMDYLRRLIEEGERRDEEWQNAVSKRVEEEKEISIEQQLDRYRTENELRRENQRQNERIDQINGRMDAAWRSSVVRCKECGELITPIQLVCHKCGAVSSFFPYDLKGDSDTIRALCESALRNLGDSIAHMNVPSAPYAEIQREYNAAYKVRTIANTYQLYTKDETRRASILKIRDAADHFLSECRNKHIEIAVVGNVKAGKSSLINALIGAKMASVDATPETSVLVKYRTTPDKNYIKVSFYTESQWNKLWDTAKDTIFANKFREQHADQDQKEYLNRGQEYAEYESPKELQDAIMHWTSSASTVHFFVSEVEVGYCGNELPHDVVLVDTPGLQDPVKFRSNITKEYISKANWVLACISYENLSSENEYKFLNRVNSCLQHDFKRMLIVATKLDMLAEEDAKKKRGEFLKSIAGFYGGNDGIAADHFVSTAPEVHFMTNQYLQGINLTAAERKKLGKALFEFDYGFSEISDKRVGILERTGIPMLVALLNKKILQKRRKEIIEMIRRDYDKARETIHTLANAQLRGDAEDLLSLKEETNKYYNEGLEIKAEIRKREAELAHLKQEIDTIRTQIEKKI